LQSPLKGTTVPYIDLMRQVRGLLQKILAPIYRKFAPETPRSDCQQPGRIERS